MKKAIKAIPVLMLVYLSTIFSSNASVISGDLYTDDGKLVELQGLEWLSLEHTSGMSVEDIANGFTDSYGNTWQSGHWRHASRIETEILLASLWGGVYEGVSSDNGDGADFFIDNFGGLTYEERYGQRLSNSDLTNWDFSGFFFGEVGECLVAMTYCYGQISAFDNAAFDINATNVLTSLNEIAYTANSGKGGIFNEYYGADFGLFNANQYLSADHSDFNIGHLLVRSGTSSISAPNSSLAFIPLLVIFFIGRIKKKSSI